MLYKKLVLGFLLVAFNSISTFAQTILEVAFFQNKYEVLFEEAQRLKKPMMLVFSTKNSSASVQMDSATLSDVYVASYISLNYLAKKIDMAEEGYSRLIKKYQVKQFPTTFFLDNKGRITGKMEGFYPADFFMKVMANNLIRSKKKYQAQATYDVYLSSL